MCLGIPGQLVELVAGSDGQLGVVDVLGKPRQVNMGMLEVTEPLVPGAWVVVHMGFAMECMDAAEAHTVLAELELVQTMGESADLER